jgi:hypothetical protein
VSDHPHAENGKQEEGHAELVSLYQPLGEATGESAAEEGFGTLVPVACPSTSDPCYKHVRHHSGGSGEGGCPKGSKGKSCGSRGGGSVNYCEAGGYFVAGVGFFSPAGVLIKAATAAGGVGVTRACS